MGTFEKWGSWPPCHGPLPRLVAANIIQFLLNSIVQQKLQLMILIDINVKNFSLNFFPFLLQKAHVFVNPRHLSHLSHSYQSPIVTKPLSLYCSPARQFCCCHCTQPKSTWFTKKWSGPSASPPPLTIFRPRFLQQTAVPSTALLQLLFFIFISRLFYLVGAYSTEVDMGWDQPSMSPRNVSLDCHSVLENFLKRDIRSQFCG